MNITLRNALMSLVGFLLCITVMSLPSTAVAAEGDSKGTGQVSFTDIGGHWGEATIRWAIERNIVSGYDDQTFRPDKTVNEPEFLVMLLRAFPDVQLAPARTSEPWHAPYYAYAEQMSWPLVHSTQAANFNRGSVAAIVAATQGVVDGQRAAITFLLDNKLASGKTSNTVEGFEAGSALKRVEALQFIKNMVDKQLTLSSGGSDQPTPPTDTQRFLVAGIQIGDAEKDVLAKLGQPARKDVSEYGFDWYIYNQDYTDYVQVGIQDGLVVGLLTNADNWRTTDGVRRGTKAAAVRDTYGKPIQMIKGNLIITEEGDEQHVFLIDDAYYATIFYDIHEDDQATAVQVIDKSVEDARKSLYPAYSAALRSAYEKQVFDLANVSRALSNLDPFDWNDDIAGTARAHSQDMAQRQFFAHENPDGLSPFDRIKADGMTFSSAAENIAAGQSNAIHVHAGWMNSLGHRSNILSDSVERLGVGIHFGGEMHLYYTQNFYTP